jgi:hypothetical protein
MRYQSVDSQHWWVCRAGRKTHTLKGVSPGSGPARPTIDGDRPQADPGGTRLRVPRRIGMVSTPVTRSGHELEIGLLRFVIVAVIALAIVLIGTVAFGWTLPAAPSFDLTNNPGADLPF